jgi:hypothetical protein
MIYVMEMSTDADIIATPLDAGWGHATARYNWGQVSQMNLGINDAAATIIVIAHGNNTEIGNAEPGVVDVTAEAFLADIQGNMFGNITPTAIYISTCGHEIAEFSAAVRIAAQNNQIWQNTRICGHCDPVSGPVPPQNDDRWVQIF